MKTLEEKKTEFFIRFPLIQTCTHMKESKGGKYTVAKVELKGMAQEVWQWIESLLQSQMEEMDNIINKYEKAEETIRNGRRFLVIDGIEKPYGYPYPDSRSKYIIQELKSKYKQV